MNDSLRTDVFVRYPPETIAVACIYLSARKLKEPLPKNPSWFNVLGVEEDDIRDCCYRMICLYDKPKPNQEELENIVDGLRKKLDEERRAQREYSNAQNTPNQSSPASRSGSPVRSHDEDKERQKENGNNGNNTAQDIHDSSPKKKKHKHKQRSRSRSRSYDDYHRTKSKKGKSSKRGSPRSPSMSPPRKRKHGHHHKDKFRRRSRSRDRGDNRRGGCASIGLHDKYRSPDRDRDRNRKRDRDYRH